MRCWNCRRPSGYREQVLKAIGGLAIALANDGKLEEAQQELDTLQKKGASSGDRDLVAAEMWICSKHCLTTKSSCITVGTATGICGAHSWQHRLC